MDKKLIFLLTLVLGSFQACQLPTRSNDYLITNFGAIGDSITLNTQAIQAAIDAAHEAGGGRVIIPPGKYVTGSIALKSNITFEVQAGAFLLGSNNFADYKPHEGTNPHGQKHQRRYLVSALGQSNIVICGKGMIDGRGKVFWEKAGEEWGFIKGKKERPDALLEVAESENITIKEVTLVNSAKWTCHMLHSKNIVIDGINIYSDMMAPNSDGIDVSGCQMVRVANCNIRTGDDAIVLKTWKNGQACEDITVTNCNLESFCAALKLGTESYQDYRRITFTNCTIKNSSRLFAVYVRDGGTVEDVIVSNLTGDTNAPLVLNRPIQLMVAKRNPDSPLGIIRNLIVQNFICKTDGRVLMTADQGGTIDNIILQNIHLDYPFIEDPTEVAANTRSNQYPQNLPEARGAKSAVVAYNIKNLKVKGLSITWPQSPVPDQWRVPLRLENGSFTAKHRYRYDRPKQTEFSAFWGRDLLGGSIEKTTLTASSPKVPITNIKKSDFLIR